LAKIPFKVSARTARLIGRENVANAEAAIIELVKNCYDADADNCIIYFDNKFIEIPHILPQSDFQKVKKNTTENVDLLTSSYAFDKKTQLYHLRPEKNEDKKKILKDIFNKICKIFIIDNGDGMTKKIIEKHWMTIGTDIKQKEIRTSRGRIRTGAKGIGRFALDRLGTKCDLFTRAKKDIGYLWRVNWHDFEKDNSTLDDISAELLDDVDLNIEKNVIKILTDVKSSARISNSIKFSKGTIIEISQLSDEWDSDTVKKLYSNLEVLIPPREGKVFDIHLFSSLEPEKYGKVEPATCDDFDYKISANIDENNLATITINRNEYDLSKFTDALFKRSAMRRFPYDRKVFKKKSFVIKKTLAQLLPGLKDINKDKMLEQIGPFDFTLYFMKVISTKKDKKKFLYRDFNRNNRRSWLSDFGGIKLFRDNFRVRPYGETGSSWEDWLGLGERIAKSPAGVAKKGGGYKVRPNNVAGVINISRLANINFEDKSSREGLQDSRIFDIFKNLILGIISEFERDRSCIARELSEYYKETNKSEETKAKAYDIAREIAKKLQQDGDGPKREPQTKEETMGVAILDQKDEIEELKAEQRLLQVFASSGITIASFTHELMSLESKLVSRVDIIKRLFSKYVTKEQCKNEPEHLNPYIRLEYTKKQDEKLKQWLNYSLNTIRKDKRLRKNINLPNYFKEFKESWKTIIENRGCEINISNDKLTENTIRAFEIDLDCIFNNLLINSLDAFQRKDAPADRDIMISLSSKDNIILITYEDSGPGLSKDIVEPDRIFEALFTTKKDKTGKDTGTGLGMWLVKSITEENGGEVQLLLDRKGFSINIKLPLKYQRNNNGKV
tara:strand:+ start:626 stop:3154 length:2529 start_codon:yes stop_codon:yes gene_type:complete